MSETDQEKTWWDQVKAFSKAIFDWIVRYPLALIAAVAVIAFASFLMATGIGGNRFNVGGILGRLFGLDDDGPDRVERANKVPENRVDEKGQAIEKGEVDDEGYTQKEVKPLDRSSNPFRDKSKLVLRDEQGDEKKIKLPEGVLDEDVDKVFEIKPQVYEVQVRNRPKERVSDDDLDLLKK